MDMRLPPLERVTFHHLQALNDEIYRVPNNRIYGAEEMCMKILGYGARGTKGARKSKPEDLRRAIIMAFSWSLALSNRLLIDLETEIRKRFPGVCPYCTTAPCGCGNKRASERSAELPEFVVERYVTSPGGKMHVERPGDKPKIQAVPIPLSVTRLQSMFSRIYPGNTLADSVAHLSEEGAELLEAYMIYTAHHGDRFFQDVVTELVDVIANLFAVANTFSEIQEPAMDLAREYISVFSNGCPKCKLAWCKCGLTIIADSVARETTIPLK